MELLWREVPGLAVVLLALLGLAWLAVRAINAVERRLITAVGLILGGIFLLTRAAELSMTAIALVLWGSGLVMMVQAGLAWRHEQSSRLWPLAAVFLLPPAVFGAMLLGGFLYSALEAPARLATRLTLR